MPRYMIMTEGFKGKEYPQLVWTGEQGDNKIFETNDIDKAAIFRNELEDNACNGAKYYIINAEAI